MREILQKKRYLTPFLKNDLSEKVVLLGGPRQSGKTTLGFSLMDLNADQFSPEYYNWDRSGDRKRILGEEYPQGKSLLVFDEIHKFKKWKNYLKGLADHYKGVRPILVTGSAKLNVFRKGGDALTGRYHYWTLHPYSLSEFAPKPSPIDLKALLKFGPFPEPLFKQSETFHRRWQNERSEQVLQEDIKDLSQVRDITQLEILLDLLPSKVGAPLSIQSIRNDLQTAHESVVKWIQIFQNLYVVFEIMPFGAPKIRAVKKEKKLYFYDWSMISDEPNQGFRFENLVACHLLKYCDFVQQSQGFKMELRFLRDTDKREVDFVVLKDKKPIFAVECKTGDREISKSILYFADRTNIPIFYQVHQSKKDFATNGNKIRVLPFEKFVVEVPLV
jgi:predicted AAA+ superfamily ATPase